MYIYIPIYMYKLPFVLARPLNLITFEARPTRVSLKALPGRRKPSWRVAAANGLMNLMEVLAYSPPLSKTRILFCLCIYFTRSLSFTLFFIFFLFYFFSFGCQQLETPIFLFFSLSGYCQV